MQKKCVIFLLLMGISLLRAHGAEIEDLLEKLILKNVKVEWSVQVENGPVPKSRIDEILAADRKVVEKLTNEKDKKNLGNYIAEQEKVASQNTVLEEKFILSLVSPESFQCELSQFQKFPALKSGDWFNFTFVGYPDGVLTSIIHAQKTVDCERKAKKFLSTDILGLPVFLLKDRVGSILTNPKFLASGGKIENRVEKDGSSTYKIEINKTIYEFNISIKNPSEPLLNYFTIRAGEKVATSIACSYDTEKFKNIPSVVKITTLNINGASSQTWRCEKVSFGPIVLTKPEVPSGYKIYDGLSQH